MLSLSFINHYAMKTYDEAEIPLHALKTSELDGVEGHPHAFTALSLGKCVIPIE
jgi:hypothetical protein